MIWCLLPNGKLSKQCTGSMTWASCLPYPQSCALLEDLYHIGNKLVKSFDLTVVHNVIACAMLYAFTLTTSVIEMLNHNTTNTNNWSSKYHPRPIF